MKKWLGVSVVVFLLTLMGMSCIVGKQTAEKADFGVVQTEGEYISQVIQSEEGNFVLFQNALEEKFQIVNTDHDLKEYQTVGTVHQGRIYYLFGYLQNQKQTWDMKPIVLGKEENWVIPVLEAEGEFLAAGGTKNEILLSILGTDQKTITEYVISLEEPEPAWSERSSFSLIDGYHILYAAYDGNKLLFQQNDGKVFCKDVIVEELETVEGTVLASYRGKGIVDGAMQNWIGTCALFSAERCILPALIVAMIVVLFLYGSSRKEPIIYRMFCYTEVASVLCFIVVGYLCAIAVAQQDFLTIEAEIEAISFIKIAVYILVVIITLVHLIAVRAVAVKWKSFSKAIAYVATEKSAYSEIPTGNDGLQMVWEPLDVIGKSMSRQNYEREVVYKSYQRFIPKGMERLLKKQEVADIALGDSAIVNGCMVNFSLENIKDYDPSAYLSVMTDSLKIMHKVREKHGGIFHSAGTDLLERKIFFEENKEAALPFAVDLIHAYAENSCLKNIDYIFMLHLSDYYYGISGVDDRMMPFMFCKEEKIMESYVKEFVKAKVKIALTEQTLALVGDHFSVRYIGFISNKELGDLKIYECLDAYDETRRKRMETTKVIFQKALELFYSNDFYLARNEFNEVLKLNEQDQIARWYLFQCEYHLNHPETEITYGLFEAM